MYEPSERLCVWGICAIFVCDLLNILPKKCPFDHGYSITRLHPGKNKQISNNTVIDLFRFLQCTSSPQLDTCSGKCVTVVYLVLRKTHKSACHSWISYSPRFTCLGLSVIKLLEQIGLSLIPHGKCITDVSNKDFTRSSPGEWLRLTF